ncbi:MAG: DUF1553 domain-containing protein [Pirellulaceae bacterium]
MVIVADRSISRCVAISFPWMITFDFPIPDSTVGTRNDSNVPAQSLALMNDPFVTACPAMCRWVARDQRASDAERIEELYLRAFARVPREAETRELIEFLERQRRHYEDQRLADAERLAWVDLCHVVVMQKEFRYVGKRAANQLVAPLLSRAAS